MGRMSPDEVRAMMTQALGAWRRHGSMRDAAFEAIVEACTSRPQLSVDLARLGAAQMLLNHYEEALPENQSSRTSRSRAVALPFKHRGTADTWALPPSERRERAARAMFALLLDEDAAREVFFASYGPRVLSICIRHLQRRRAGDGACTPVPPAALAHAARAMPALASRVPLDAWARAADANYFHESASGPDASSAAAADLATAASVLHAALSPAAAGSAEGERPHAAELELQGAAWKAVARVAESARRAAAGAPGAAFPLAPSVARGAGGDGDSQHVWAVERELARVTRGVTPPRARSGGYSDSDGGGGDAVVGWPSAPRPDRQHQAWILATPALVFLRGVRSLLREWADGGRASVLADADVASADAGAAAGVAQVRAHVAGTMGCVLSVPAPGGGPEPVPKGWVPLLVSWAGASARPGAAGASTARACHLRASAVCALALGASTSAEVAREACARGIDPFLDCLADAGHQAGAPEAADLVPWAAPSSPLQDEGALCRASARGAAALLMHVAAAHASEALDGGKASALGSASLRRTFPVPPVPRARRVPRDEELSSEMGVVAGEDAAAAWQHLQLLRREAQERRAEAEAEAEAGAVAGRGAEEQRAAAGKAGSTAAAGKGGGGVGPESSSPPPASPSAPRRPSWSWSPLSWFRGGKGGSDADESSGSSSSDSKQEGGEGAESSAKDTAAPAAEGEEATAAAPTADAATDTGASGSGHAAKRTLWRRWSAQRSSRAPPSKTGKEGDGVRPRTRKDWLSPVLAAARSSDADVRRSAQQALRSLVLAGAGHGGLLSLAEPRRGSQAVTTSSSSSSSSGNVDGRGSGAEDGGEVPAAPATLRLYARSLALAWAVDLVVASSQRALSARTDVIARDSGASPPPGVQAQGKQVVSEMRTFLRDAYGSRVAGAILKGVIPPTSRAASEWDPARARYATRALAHATAYAAPLVAQEGGSGPGEALGEWLHAAGLSSLLQSLAIVASGAASEWEGRGGTAVTASHGQAATGEEDGEGAGHSAADRFALDTVAVPPLESALLGARARMTPWGAWRGPDVPSVQVAVLPREALVGEPVGPARGVQRPGGAATDGEGEGEDAVEGTDEGVAPVPPGDSVDSETESAQLASLRASGVGTSRSDAGLRQLTARLAGSGDDSDDDEADATAAEVALEDAIAASEARAEEEELRRAQAEVEEEVAQTGASDGSSTLARIARARADRLRRLARQIEDQRASEKAEALEEAARATTEHALYVRVQRSVARCAANAVSHAWSREGGVWEVERLLGPFVAVWTHDPDLRLRHTAWRAAENLAQRRLWRERERRREARRVAERRAGAGAAVDPSAPAPEQAGRAVANAAAQWFQRSAAGRNLQELRSRLAPWLRGLESVSGGHDHEEGSDGGAHSEPPVLEQPQAQGTASERGPALLGDGLFLLYPPPPGPLGTARGTATGRSRVWWEQGGLQVRPPHELAIPGSRWRDVDLVFVHGVHGGPIKTWRGWAGSCECWPSDWLARDLVRAGYRPRVLSTSYTAHIMQLARPQQALDIRERAQQLGEQLERAHVGTGATATVFVAHSLGGLLVKEMLATAAAVAKEAEQVAEAGRRGAVFYGTPHHGSPLARLSPDVVAALLPVHPTMALMRPGNPFLGELNDAYTALGLPTLSLAEENWTPLYQGMGTMVVPPRSADPGMGAFRLIRGSNHLDVCKPLRTSDSRYTWLLDFVMAVVEDRVDATYTAASPDRKGVPEEESEGCDAAGSGDEGADAGVAEPATPIHGLAR